MSENLNPGRDLRAEAKEAVFTCLENAACMSNVHQGIDIILETLEGWLGSLDILFGKLGYPVPIRPIEPFLGVSDALTELDVTGIDTHYILSILTSTHQFKKKIPAYSDFYWRARKHLEKTDPQNVDGLLMGFEPEV